MSQQSKEVRTVRDHTAIELETYRSLVAMYNSEEASFWTRNNILAAIQGALLASTAAIVGNADKALAPGASAAPAVLLFSALATLALGTWYGCRLDLHGRSQRADCRHNDRAIEKDRKTPARIRAGQTPRRFSCIDEIRRGHSAGKIRRLRHARRRRKAA